MTDITQTAPDAHQDAGSGDETCLEDVLDQLAEAGDAGEVSVNDVIETFADRSLGAVLAAFGTLAALPLIGAIPGVSILVGTIIVLFITRSVIGGGALRLPASIGDRTVGDEKLSKAVEKARPTVQWIDRWLKTRLTVLTEGRPARTAIALCSGVLAVSMAPLALVPWGVQAPATGIVAFGLALIARDGLFALIGYALAALTAGVAFWLL